MGTVSVQFDVAGAQLFSSGIPELVNIPGTGTIPWPVVGYAFDAAADEFIYFKFKVRNYGSGNVSINVDWYSRTGQTTGNAFFSAALGCITDGDAQSIESKTLATASTAASTVNSTAKGLHTWPGSITNLDSITNGDFCILRLGRLGSNGSDTITGDIVVVGVELQYSDT